MRHKKAGFWVLAAITSCLVTGCTASPETPSAPSAVSMSTAPAAVASPSPSVSTQPLPEPGSTRGVDLAETTRQIVDSGIAERMLHATNNPQLPKTTEGCRFWVEKYELPRSGMLVVAVIIEYPPVRSTQAFSAERGESFGVAGDRPLTEAQMRLVDQLADDWTKNAHK